MTRGTVKVQTNPVAASLISLLLYEDDDHVYTVLVSEQAWEYFAWSQVIKMWAQGQRFEVKQMLRDFQRFPLFVWLDANGQEVQL